MKRILAFTLIPLAVLACAGPQINVEEEVEEETKTYSLDLQQPENSTVWTLEADKTYYIKFKSVLKDTEKEHILDYMEYCAKEVYDNPRESEDIW